MIARLAVVVFLVSATGARGAISFDTACSVGCDVVDTCGCTLTGTSAADRVGVYGVVINSSTVTLVSLTHGGVEVTPHDASVVGIRVEMRHRVAFPSGVQTITCQVSEVERYVCGASTYTGVHQTTPMGPAVTAGSNTGAAATVAVSSSSGQLVVDVVGWSGGPVIVTPGDQNERWQNDVTDEVSGASSEEPGAATVTMSHTITGDGPWGQVGAELIAVATPTTRRRMIHVRP